MRCAMRAAGARLHTRRNCIVIWIVRWETESSHEVLKLVCEASENLQK